MKYIFFLAALFLFTASRAQHPTWAVKLCPLSLIDEASFATVQGGLEFNLSKKLSWYNEMGLGYRKSYYDAPDSQFISPKGIKLKSEIRWYLYQKNSGPWARVLEGSYLAANFFYTGDHHNAAVYYFLNGDSSDEHRDVFSVHKQVWGFNLLSGKQRSIGRHFMIDVYYGLGIRFRKIANDHLEYVKQRDFLHGPVDLTINSMRNWVDVKPGRSVTGNLTTGLRLVYRLGR
jgi:hypothetical protein